MISFFVEVLLQIILEFLLILPGSVLLWAAKGFKGPFKLAVDSNHKPEIFGILFWLILGSITYGIVQIY